MTSEVATDMETSGSSWWATVEATVNVSDIRSFTTIVELQTPAETIELV